MSRLEIIHSKDNTLIKEIRKLKEKKYRAEKGRFLIEGFRFVEEALKSSYDVPMIIVSENQKERWNSFHIEDQIKLDTKVLWVTESILKNLSSTDSPQGIVAVVENKRINIIDRHGFYVLVDKLQDPGNMGTVIRTAHAAGALGIIYTKGTVDIYNEKTLRSTMGSIFNIPIIEDNNFDTIDYLKSKKFKFLISSLDAEKNFYEEDLTGKMVICVGNEGNGISEEVKRIGDIKVKIPMPGSAESLNVAVASGIMMFETVRQMLTTKSK